MLPPEGLVRVAVALVEYETLGYIRLVIDLQVQFVYWRRPWLTQAIRNVV